MHTQEMIERKEVLEFWKQKFGTEITNDMVSHFELSRLSKSEQKKPEELSVSLSEEQHQRIIQLCSGSEILEYNFHLTCLNALLNRYLGVQSIIIGASAFPPNEQNVLSFFKTTISAEENFKSLFVAIKQELSEVMSVPGIGANGLQELFDTEELLGLMSLGLIMEGVNTHAAATREFNMLIKVSGKTLTASFDSNRYDARLIKFFLENYLTVLNAVLNDPYIPITQLPYLSAEQENILLSDFQGKEKKLDFPNAVARFEAQADKMSEKIAVQFGDKSISYAELNSGSNQLARYLSFRHPLKADELVGLVMDRSEKMVTSILAIWKSGAAYVPIDPEYPAERIKSILDNSGCKLILSESSVSKDIQSLLSAYCPVILVDEIADSVKGLPAGNIDVPIHDSSLAYVIYTSGSTGKPKGVMIEHNGMMNHLEAKCSEMGIVEDSIVAQNASQCFDISVWQLFAALMVGGKTVIYENKTVMNVEDFAENIHTDKVTVLELVPSYLLELQRILDENTSGDFWNAMKIVILNAETLLPQMVQRWVNRFPQIPIVNTYGATEVSDDMSHFIMNGVPETATVPVMYRPIQNFHLYILNEEQQLCPVGVKGEIYLSGFAVGRGYLNDPERTRASFITDFFERRQAIRMYRTGDVGRLLPDGSMEFYGRKDYQVKIRGYRVELGEIEHQLTKIDGVKNAVVLDKESPDQQKYLVAYLLAGNELNVDGVREQLKDQLPDYMIPSYFIKMDRFELTPNGKINKKVLPEPVTKMTVQEEPRNETEQKLLEIWREILNRPVIGLKENFFEVGGHSLLATKLVYKVHKELQVKLDLRKVFVHPTIEGLSNEIRNAQKVVFTDIQQVPIQEYYDLSPSQKRLWILCQFEGTSVAYNMSGANILNGKLDISAFDKAFETVVKRHESLRTVFTTKNGEPKQKILLPEEIAFKVGYEINHLKEESGEISLLAEKESLQPFDLSKDILIRVNLTEIAPDKHLFTITIHHIIGDGWSMDVLVNELLQLYAAFAQHKELKPEPLRIQYKDFAAWQNQQLSGENLIVHRDYWLKQFSGELPVLELPTDRPRPAVQTFNGDSVDFQLDEKLTAQLRAFSKTQDATLFAILLSASQVLFYKYSGQTDLIIGSPIAGREHNDLENQVGFYVNTLALRSRFDGSETFRSLLSKNKENLVDAYEHQLYPFDYLVDELNLQRDLSRNALFDVMVALQNTNVKGIDTNVLPGLQVEHLGSIRKVSMFDLSISFAEEGEVLEASFEYNTDLFEKERIEKMKEHFLNLLNNLLANPESKIANAKLLSEKEQQELIHSFNQTATAFENTLPVIKRFEENVARFATRTALIYEGKTHTYQDLNIKAGRLAAFLKNHYSIQKGDVVAIHLGRSLDAVVSMLAILKLNAAFLPIDIYQPEERINTLLTDSHARLVITENKNQWVKPALIIKEHLDEIRSQAEYFSGEINSSEPVYLIYTSGSTGQPKGVKVSGDSLENYVNWFISEQAITENDSTLIVSSLSFDLSYTSLWSCLVAGGCLVIPNESRYPDPDEIIRQLSEYAITYIKLTPSHFKLLLNHLDVESQPSLRLAVLGGENIQAADVAAFLNKFPEALVVNHYGPTETTIGAVTKRITGKNIGAFAAAPVIGNPIANNRIYILDRDGKPVPVGITGELHISGRGVALGYHNSPELTEEKFIPNPFVQNEKMYKTGDLGRWRSNGDIELLGRADSQIKIRGYRVELDEIENAIKKLEGVQHASVVAREKGDDKELVAFVQGSGYASPVAGEHKRYKLPNNLAVVQLNKNETDYIYKEIFELQAYRKHGIAFEDNACIIDVGANIGLFSLFANTVCKQPKIYAFEPNPVIHELTQLNLALYCKDAEVLNYGLSDAERKSTFTFFKGFSLLSGLYTDSSNEKEVVKKYMDNQENPEMRDLVVASDKLLEKRFDAETFQVELKTLSGFIAEKKITRIDILKINVEKAELDVLRGIDKKDWTKIRQIILEVDVDEHLETIQQLLIDNNFEIFTEQDMVLEGTQLRYIYAINKQDVLKITPGENKQPLPLPVFTDQMLSDQQIKDFLKTQLPDYMIPLRLVYVADLPLTPNGKVDRKLLSKTKGLGVEERKEYVKPENAIELSLSSMWESILGINKIGIHEHFFELGGNSLKVVELFRRLDVEYPETLSVTDLFDKTSIASQAQLIAERASTNQTQEKTEAFREIEL